MHSIPAKEGSGIIEAAVFGAAFRTKYHIIRSRRMPRGVAHDLLRFSFAHFPRRQSGDYAADLPWVRPA